MPTEHISAKEFRITQGLSVKGVAEVKPKKPHTREESAFEKEFAFIANRFDMLYFKIPDPIYSKDKIETMRNKGRSDEHKRPFDGVLITKGQNYCIEFKVGYKALSPHQIHNERKINQINISFLVIRKLPKDYRVDWFGKQHKFDTIIDMCRWIYELTGDDE